MRYEIGSGKSSYCYDKIKNIRFTNYESTLLELTFNKKSIYNANQTRGKSMQLSNEIIKVIGRTLDKGNTVEVRVRKDDIVVYETTKKTIQTFPIKV